MKYQVGMMFLLSVCSLGIMTPITTQATYDDSIMMSASEMISNKKNTKSDFSKKVSNKSTGSHFNEGKVSKEKEKEEGKDKVDLEKKRKLNLINSQPLTETDFWLSQIKLEEPIDKMVALKGKPEQINQSFLRDEYHWDGLSVVKINEMPYQYANRRDLSLHKKIPFHGITSFYIDGETAVTARGIDVGDLRENVLRAYGIPTEILWDGEKREFHLLYIFRNKELDFTIRDNKVFSIRMSMKKTSENFVSVKNRVPGIITTKDLHLAGFKIGDKLSAYSWDTWERKMTTATEATWYYSGYAVKVTGKNAYIDTIFLSDNQMISSRGLALGDDISTAEFLYGKPHKMELSTSSGHPRTSYIYFSKDKQYILILFFVKQKVDGILVTKNPQIKK